MSLMDEKLTFIRMRMQGYSFEPVLQKRFDDCQEAYQEKDDEFSEALNQRKEKVEAVVDGLINQIQNITLTAPASAQVDNLSQTIKDLTKIQKDLQEGLSEEERKLLEQQKGKELLQENLVALQKRLQEGSRVPKGLISQGGRNLSRRIAGMEMEESQDGNKRKF